MKIKIPTIIYLTIFFITCLTTLSGQITKGNFILEGSSNSIFTKYEDLYSSREQTNFRTESEISATYFLNNNLAIGGKFGIVTEKEQENLYALGLDVRYYFNKPNQKAWFLTSNINYGKLGITYLTNGTLGIGLDYFANQNIAIETVFSVGYSQQKLPDFYGFQPSPILSVQLNTGLKFFLNTSTKQTSSKTTNKGRLMGGISASSFSFHTSKGNNSWHIALSPDIGVVIHPKWIIGSRIGFNFQKQNGFVRQDFSLELAPFTRFYPITLHKKTALFFEVGGGYHITKAKIDIGENTIIKDKRISLHTGVGLNLFISKSVALELKGIYQYLDYQTDSKTNRVVTSIGFQYFL